MYSIIIGATPYSKFTSMKKTSVAASLKKVVWVGVGVRDEG
jgi:hypothetical protein